MKEAREENLTDQVLEYKRTGAGLQKVIRRAALIVYSYPRRRLRWNDDDSSDFFCLFFPKIRRLVERFEYTGKPFEAYLLTTVHWQLKSFAAQRALERARRKVIEREQVEQLRDAVPRPRPWPEAVCEPASIDQFRFGASDARSLLQDMKVGRDGRVVSEVYRRRIVILAMKGIALLNHDDLCYLAEITGYDLEWIEWCRDQLWSRLEARRARISELRRRRNTAYFRIYYLNERLIGGPDGMDKSHLLTMIAFERECLERAQERLARLNMCPTHHDISEVLGIPKGSVDSSMFYFRNSMINRSNSAGTKPGRQSKSPDARLGLN